jgi:type IV pilus assembly protein PilC
MPTFHYKAWDKDGQEQRGEIEASSQEDARTKIRAKGFFPGEVREKQAAAGGAKKSPAAAGAKAPAKPVRPPGAVSLKKLTAFTRQLATLQEAGLPILRSLRILEQQQKGGNLKTTLRMVADDVEGGSTLSEAMSKYPKCFDRLYVNMVHAGEAGGVLETILERLAEFMEKAAKLKAKVLGAMVYPAAVIFFACLIVTGIMLFIVPQFEKIFSDFKLNLPAMTVFLITMSSFIGNGGWIVVLLTPVIIWGGIKLIKMTKGGKYAWDLFTIKVPIFGQIVHKSSVARFTRTLGTLISSGVPILEALTITKETTGNEVFARALTKVRDAIREGENMAAPLKTTKIVDSLVVNMIDVGEETGELDKMLIRIADNYDEEVDVLVGSLVSLLEPVMVIMLGCIVGFIVISLFLPMIELIKGVA